MSGEVAQWFNDKKCPACGKRFTVIWPHQWAYKTGRDKSWRYYCSWKCLRTVDQGKREYKEFEDMKRKTVSQVEMGLRLIEAAEKGADPLVFLREQGYGNAEKAYQNIKARIRMERPDLLPRFPAKKDGRNERKAKPREPETESFIRVDAEKVEIGKRPLYKLPDGMEITAVRFEKYGEFYYDKRRNEIDWRNEAGDEISLTPGGWADLARDLPGILKALGAWRE